MNVTGDSSDQALSSEQPPGTVSDLGINDHDLLKDLANDLAGPELKPGATLGEEGRYTLLSQLGEGGSSYVWLAKDGVNEEEVALKIFKPYILADSGGAKRLLREIRAIQSLDHPHIVKVLEIRERERHPFFAMQWINGRTLKELVDHHKFYRCEDRLAQAKERQKQAAELLAVIANALHHTHQRGIIHRDIKSGNILVEESELGLGKPYLTDYGLSKRTDVNNTVLTASGYMPGTLGYYAPERILKTQDVTTSWDIWGLGVVLYELLTGRLPFQGRSDFEVHAATIKGAFLRPVKLNPKVDRDLEAICLKCLRRNPDRRYPSARALAEDLEDWLAGKAISVRRQSVWARTWEWVHRNPLAAAFAASVLLGPTVTALSYVLILPYLTNTHAVRRFQNGVLELEVLAQKNERCSFNIRKDPLREHGGQWAVMHLQGNTNGLPSHLSFCLLADQGGLPDPVRSGPITPGVPFKVRPGVWLGDYLDRYYYLGGINFDPRKMLAGRTDLTARIFLTNAPSETPPSAVAVAKQATR